MGERRVYGLLVTLPLLTTYRENLSPPLVEAGLPRGNRGRMSPAVRAQALPVLSPGRAANATRAVHSALYWFRWGDSSPRLISS